MDLGIFIYGTVVFAIVCTALGLLAWGIIAENRDRSSFERGAEVFGTEGASVELKRNSGTSAR